MIVLLIIETAIVVGLVYTIYQNHKTIESLKYDIRTHEKSFKDFNDRLNNQFTLIKAQDQGLAELEHDFDNYTQTMKQWGDDLVKQVTHDHFVGLQTSYDLGRLNKEMHQPYFGEEVLDPDDKEYWESDNNQITCDSKTTDSIV